MALGGLIHAKHSTRLPCLILFPAPAAARRSGLHSSGRAAPFEKARSAAVRSTVASGGRMPVAV